MNSHKTYTSITLQSFISGLPKTCSVNISFQNKRNNQSGLLRWASEKHVPSFQTTNGDSQTCTYKWNQHIRVRHIFEIWNHPLKCSSKRCFRKPTLSAFRNWHLNQTKINPPHSLETNGIWIPINDQTNQTHRFGQTNKTQNDESQNASKPDGNENHLIESVATL